MRGGGGLNKYLHLKGSFLERGAYLRGRYIDKEINTVVV